MIVKVNRKSKRLTIFLFSLVAVFFIFFFVLNHFQIVKIYKEVTTVNEPNIVLGSHILVSKLKKPQLGNFVIIKHSDTVVGDYEAMFRIMGASQDTIAFKYGMFYRNGENTDQTMSLSHSLLISRSTRDKLKSANVIISEQPKMWTDTFLVQINNQVASNYKLGNQQVLSPPNEPDELIENIYKQRWNKDNFGPLVIPKGKFFVVGDNRDAAYDSRYIGLIDESDIVGTYLWNW